MKKTKDAFDKHLLLNNFSYNFFYHCPVGRCPGCQRTYLKEKNGIYDQNNKNLEIEMSESFVSEFREYFTNEK